VFSRSYPGLLQTDTKPCRQAEQRCFYSQDDYKDYRFPRIVLLLLGELLPPWFE
jgi:hypothetical protein